MAGLTGPIRRADIPAAPGHGAFAAATRPEPEGTGRC
jgi:hypothetical protein